MQIAGGVQPSSILNSCSNSSWCEIVLKKRDGRAATPKVDKFKISSGDKVRIQEAFHWTEVSLIEIDLITSLLKTEAVVENIISAKLEMSRTGQSETFDQSDDLAKKTAL